MQRPTRIVVFGVICLIVGGMTGVKNTIETAVAMVGPEGLEQMVNMMEGMNQPLTASQKEDFDLQIATQRKPVYRYGQLVESLCSAVMAVVLIAAGVGLLRDRVWALRVARWWAYYGIPAAGVSVILTVRYVLPELPDAPLGGGVFQGAFMLLTLWALPVLLLRHLPTQAVKAYLAQREAQRSGTHVPQPYQSPIDQVGVAPSTMPPQPGPPSTPPTTSHVPDSTWRDDPWNDPNSR